MMSKAKQTKKPSDLLSLKKIVEGTSIYTGQEFFDSLVKNLAQVLGVHGVWITEVQEDMRQLSALSFWLDGKFVDEYIYQVKGTPCEPVLSNPGICHIPENVVELYPDDPDLKPLGAVSYMGLALKDTDDTILGHLALLDNKPMDEIPEVFAIFKIFASRAAAEMRRIQADQKLLDNKQKLERLVNGSMDSIIELNGELVITQANQSASKLFKTKSLEGSAINAFLDQPDVDKLEKAIRTLEKGEQFIKSTWIPGHLSCITAKNDSFPAEASVSVYREKENKYFVLYIRNVKEQVKAGEALKDLSIEANMLRERIAEHQFFDIVGESPAITAAIELVRQVAITDSTVLITGETGTGKELFARAIHESSERHAKPLITLNCAALPPEIIESELFGHVKGAFTGAVSNRDGRFSLADQGTIFLDEVGEMPLQLQSKLLRVLQEQEFQPVGSSRTVKVDVRVIAATNKDLMHEVGQGKFREDLYYRLSVFPIHLPPLRARDKDVLLLANAFINKHCSKRGITPIHLDTSSEKLLLSHSWPGNVRELQNIVERAFITSRGGWLDLATGLQLITNSNEQIKDVDHVLTEVELIELQKRNILKALDLCNGKISGPNGAARLLQIPPTTLASRVKKLGIEL